MLTIKTEPPLMPRKTAAKNAEIPAASAAEAPNLTASHSLIIKAFDDCQRSFASHPKYVNLLRASFSKAPQEFFDGFIREAGRILLIYKREPSVERLVDFISLFAEATPGWDSDFAIQLLQYFLTTSSSAEKAVRFRSVQIITRLFEKLPEDAEVSEELYDRIKSTLLTRLHDKVPTVRAQTVLSLKRLQEEDDVTEELRRAMATDSSKDVRKAVVSALFLQRANLPHLLARARDSSAEVRRRVYAVLHEAGAESIRVLSIQQRVQLVRLGLQDRDASVVKACSTLICQTWLKKVQYNIVELLKLFSVEHFVEDAERLLLHVLQHAPPQALANTPKPPFQIGQLSSEQTLYWRILADHTREQAKGERDEKLEELLCDTVNLCEMLASPKLDPAADFSSSSSSLSSSSSSSTSSSATASHVVYTSRASVEFVRTELLKLALHMDPQDEVGARRLELWLRDELLNLKSSAEQIPHLMKAIKFLHPDETDFVRLVLELAEDIRDPLDDQDEGRAAQRVALEQQADELQQRIQAARAELRTAVEQQEFETAARLKKSIGVFVTEADSIDEQLDALGGPDDDATWLRLVHVVGELLALTDKVSKNPAVLNLRATYLIPGVQHSEPLVRQAAFRALGLYALMGRAAAKENLMILMQPLIHGDSPLIQNAALKGVSDLLLLYGMGITQSVANNNSGDADEAAQPAEAMLTPGDVLQSILAFLPDDDEDLRTTATESVSKLLYLGRVADPQILSMLLISYFNPATQEDAHLRQCLSLFFPAFLSVSASHRSLMCTALLPTIRTLVEAPDNSPLATINISQMMQVMLAMMDDADQHAKAVHAPTETPISTSHEEIMFQIAAEICGNPDAVSVRSFCHMMSLLNFSADNQHNIKSFRHLVARANSSIQDKLSLKSLAKVEQKLLELDATPDVGLDGDALDSLQNKIPAASAASSSSSSSSSSATATSKPRAAGKVKSTVKKPRTKKLGGRGKKDWELSESESSEEEVEDENNSAPVRAQISQQFDDDSENNDDEVDSKHADDDEDDEEEAVEVVAPKRGGRASAKSSAAPAAARPSRASKTKAEAKMAVDPLQRLDEVLDEELVPKPARRAAAKK